MAGHGIFHRFEPLGPLGGGGSNERLNALSIGAALTPAIIGEGNYNGMNKAQIKAELLSKLQLALGDGPNEQLADGQLWGDEITDVNNIVECAAGITHANADIQRLRRLLYAEALEAACVQAAQPRNDDLKKGVMDYDEWHSIVDNDFSSFDFPRQDKDGYTSPADGGGGVTP